VTARFPLAELATLFLRLGITAFGGPAAHIAMMRDEVVDRRNWLTDAEFLDLLAATHLIPGPNSTEMAIHLGYRRGGLPGLLVAGACFILPACLIVGMIAWGYVRYGDTPQVGWLMSGIGPVIIAIVAQALWKLGKSALTGVFPTMVALVVAALALAGFDELALLGGAAGVSLLSGVTRSGTAAAVLTALIAAPAALGAATLQTATEAPVTLTRLGLFFLKVGSVLFGSGYVLLAFLRADLTDGWGWLTDQQLIDAITVGQVTPGPVFTTATFIGYLLAGWPGAVVATIGIFAPGFVFVALSHPFIPRLRASPVAGALLDGVVAASLGLMAAVTWQLARSAILDPPSLLLALAAAVGLSRWQLSSTWVILGGGAIGWMLQGG
jgi:chromate transporter